jgi:hypothetical protein
MTITLQYQTTTLNLDPDLYWADENNWHPVEQSTQRTVTGAVIISNATRTGGRPITLQPYDDRSAWMSRSMLDTLRSWAAVAGREMTLTLRGQAYTVVFRHSETAIEADPIFHFSDTDASDWFRVTLRFLEV